MKLREIKKEKWLFFVILLYLLVNIPGLFVPFVVDAAKYARIGREILVNHDWINLTIGGVPYKQKPPLLFWIAALAFKTFGTSVIAYKIAILLISLIGVYGTFRLGELLYDKRTGTLAAFFWVSCVGYVHFHNDIHTDTLLVVPVTLSIWQYAAYFKYRKNYQFILGTVFIGLAMLTKGLVGMVIPGAAVGLHLLFTRNFKAIFNYRWLLAVPIVFILILPALWGLYSQFGPEGIKFYFWTNNIGRLNGSYQGSNTDPFFYIHTTLYIIVPWTAFVLAGFFMQIYEKVQKKWRFTKNNEFYTLGGVLFYLIIGSVARGKAPHYEMAILPLLLIIAARWAYIIFEKTSLTKTRKIIGYINYFTAIISLLLIIPFLTFIFPENRIWIYLVLVLMSVAFIYVLMWKDSLNKQLACLLISISAFLFTLNTSIIPHMSLYHSPLETCRIFNEQAQDDEKLNIYTKESHFWDILLYSKNYGCYIITPEDYKQINPPANDYLYTGPKGVRQLAQMNIQVDTIRVFQHRSLSRVSLKFLNPKTRPSTLKTCYLLRIRD